MIERELKKKFELASKLAEFSALLDEFKRKFLEERSNKTWNRFSIPGPHGAQKAFASVLIEEIVSKISNK